MPLSAQQKANLDYQINQIKEDGLFLPEKCSMASDTRYLIISTGGTGAAALLAVKKLFEAQLNEQDLKERIRFLAVDTDRSTQHVKKIVRNPDGTSVSIVEDALTDNQFFWLDNHIARQAVIPFPKPQAAKWLNPQLAEQIRWDTCCLDGTGARGTRQLGRLAMYPGITNYRLSHCISALAAELTNGNTCSLRVWILSGIAGGTGSGTLVDLTYLVRDSMPAHLANRVQYGGFILLPPTGRAQNLIEIQRVNCTGYAALKEINHFMTLKQRGDTYSFTDDNGRTVVSRQNLFDACYLFDGRTNTVSSCHPNEAALRVLSESLLDMVTSSQAVGGGMMIPVSDIFLRDMSAHTNQIISQHSVRIAPRDADYIYSSLSRCEFVMPTGAIKAYVARHLFERVYHVFTKVSQVQAQDAADFIAAVIANDASNPVQIQRSMTDKVQACFTDIHCGPFYVVNLMSAVADEASRLMEQIRIFRPRMISNQALDCIRHHALSFNREIFETYTSALDGLRTLMEDQFNAVLPAEKGNNTYTFIPMSLGTMQNAESVERLLDKLIDHTNLQHLCDDLLQEMMHNGKAWITLTRPDPSGANNAPAAIRKFWEDQLEKILDITLEDFLIKLFANDPNAHYDPSNPQAAAQYLNSAVKEIYHRMVVNVQAEPLVQLNLSGLMPTDFNCRTCLMVPKCAPNLRQALIAYAQTQPHSVVICETTASDRISCCRQYSGIPAFQLRWVRDAEMDYERALLLHADRGLHLSETAEGIQWRDMPNLMPRSTWNTAGFQYENPREWKLAEKARQLFDAAKSFGLVTVSAFQGMPLYQVETLSSQIRPDRNLLLRIYRGAPGSHAEQQLWAELAAAAKTCAQTLFEQLGTRQRPENLAQALASAGVAFAHQDLYFPARVNTPAPSDQIPDWDALFAAMMLRRLPDTMLDLESTLMVMTKLYDKFCL